MRKECKTRHAKAVDLLVLAVDHFNRAWDRGRTEAVLILMDRAFELLLKAIIVHRAGGDAIRQKEGRYDIGFRPLFKKMSIRRGREVLRSRRCCRFTKS